MKNKDAGKLLNKLEEILEKQKELIKAGSFKGLEDLTNKAGEIIGQLQGKELSGEKEIKQKNRLMKAYKHLILGIEAEKGKLKSRLNKLKKTKRTMSAYKRSVEKD